MLSKKIIIIILFCLSAISNLSAETFPDFSSEYWTEEYSSARGKMLRGIVLGITGLGAIAPTAIFIKNAVDNPEHYLAFSFVSGIASLGMMGHGFSSIFTGIRERRKAEYFSGIYTDNPDNINLYEQQDYYLYLKRKTASKMIIFGSVISIQSAILFSNGIILSVRKNRGEDTGDIRIWPNYAVGGLLLAGGTFLIINNIRKLKNFRQLDIYESENSTVTFLPVFGIDTCSSSVSFGFTGEITY